MRPRTPRGTISRHQVVDAALTVADRDGLHRVSIRAVAAEVGVPPMTLYTHFAGKEQLYDLMFERVFHRLFDTAGSATWQAEFEAGCRSARRVLLAHPHWLPLLTRVTAPPASIRFFDRLLRHMRADGFTWDAALYAFSSAMSFALGFVLVERMMAGGRDAPVPVQRLALVKATIAREPPKAFAAIAWAAPHFDEWSFDNVFDLGLRSLIVGIEERCSRPPPARKRGARRSARRTPPGRRQTA